MRFAILFFAGVVAVSAPASADKGRENYELVSAMGSLQYFLHKTGLALRSANYRLASFYLHEIEEVLEEIGKVKSYDGHPVGKMSGEATAEVLEALERAVKDEKRGASRRAYSDMIKACNTCHTATDHGFIKVRDRSGRNPFMQSFGK